MKEELLRQAKERDAHEEAVSLSTMHSSKGLEYRIVFIIDTERGNYAAQARSFEEDGGRKGGLFYVAMTRAKELLYLFSTRKLYGKKAERSRFVEEFLEEDCRGGKPPLIFLNKKIILKM